MAGTYYKYAERDVDSQIDWSQVGKDLTTMLDKETKLREEKKDAIDKATREAGNLLANPPQGEHTGINSWALTYADNAQKARLLQDRLLKSGQLKLKDYNIMRQNLTDGTTQAFGLIKDYQAEYSDKMERYRKGESQALEQWLMGEAEAFANFNNSELYINPTDYTVSVALKEKQIIDGKEVMAMSKDPNKFTTVAAMKNRIKGKYDKFNVAASLQQGVQVLGKEIQSVKQYGKITEVMDITKRKGFGVDAKSNISVYEKAEDTYLESLMVQPTNISSILTDYVGVDPETKLPYTFTWDSDISGGSMILLKNDPSGRPNPIFTEEQRKVAKEALRTKFRIMLDRTEEIKAVTEPQKQQWQVEGQKKDVALAAEGRILADMYGGDAGQVQAAVDHFNGLSNVAAVDRTADKLTVKFKDGTVKEVKIAGASKNDFVKAASKLLLGDEADVNKVLTGANQVQYGAPSANIGSSVSVSPKAGNPLQEYTQFVDSLVPSDSLSLTVAGDEEGVRDALNKSIQKLGFTASVPWTMGNYIVIKNSEGKESEEISLDDPQAASEAVKAFMSNNVPGKDEVEKMQYIMGLKQKGLISGGGTSSSTGGTIKGGNVR